MKPWTKLKKNLTNKQKVVAAPAMSISRMTYVAIDRSIYIYTWRNPSRSRSRRHAYHVDITRGRRRTKSIWMDPSVGLGWWPRQLSWMCRPYYLVRASLAGLARVRQPSLLDGIYSTPSSSISAPCCVHRWRSARTQSLKPCVLRWVCPAVHYLRKLWGSRNLNATLLLPPFAMRV
jgi:hypothetical protein